MESKSISLAQEFILHHLRSNVIEFL